MLPPRFLIVGHTHPESISLVLIAFIELTRGFVYPAHLRARQRSSVDRRFVMKKVNIEYGLELTMNSKVGPAFSLSRSSSCVNKTKICERVCYGNGIRYRSAAQTNKRMRNFKTAEFLIQNGGTELLAENLISIVDQARPIDYLAASITKTDTAIPWTMRIHDVGDYPEFRTIPC
jgi:hypothetical protein